MLEWPVISWLWPKSTVRLYLPTGELALSRDLHTQPVLNGKRVLAARFETVVLPENLLLRRKLELPKLQPLELSAALTLETQALCPFSPGDLVWAHETGQSDNSAVLHIELVMTSRKLIEKYISTISERLKTKTPEVWVPRANGVGFIMLAGFGEARRKRQSTAWRWASALLAMLVLTLIAAIAATPSVKLYLRATQAKQAMTTLQKKSAPVLAQRESLLHATEQLAAVTALVDQPVTPLQILKLITETLPDDTSLLGLQIEGLKVNISGQTVNATSLMKQLDSTPGLRDVKAPTPATKPLGAPRESFTIEFTVVPTQLKPAL